MSNLDSRADGSCRIAIFNVKYSPNVGDGAIAESLEAELVRQDCISHVQSIDLAGRSDYGTGLKHRGAVMALLQRLGPASREAVAQVLLRALTEFRLRPAWRRSLEGQDAVVIGGGQLIQGTDLNFPVKLDAAMREVRRKKLPCVVYGVGVAQTLSAPARRLFHRAFAGSLSAVYVRDAESQAAWDRHFAGADIPKAKLCRDPAILMDSVVPPPPPAPRERRLIGVGLAAPLVLAHHSLDQHFEIGTLDVFWSSLCAALVAADFDVALFTNGAEEDELYLEHLYPKLAVLGEHRITRIARPNNPRDLATSIAGVDGLISHRLHANILALAYRKPHIGLTWDAKLTSFFHATGRADCALPAMPDQVETMVARLKREVEQGLAGTSHAQLQAETRGVIEHAAAVLCAAVRTRPTRSAGA